MSEPGGTARHHWVPKTVLPGPGHKGPGRAVLAKLKGKSPGTPSSPICKSKMNEDFLCIMEDHDQAQLAWGGLCSERRKGVLSCVSPLKNSFDSDI